MLDKISLNLPGSYEIEAVAGMPEGGLSATANIVRWGTTTFLIVTIILAIYFLIWGGISWITSGGDKARLEAARKRIIFAIIGLIVAFSAFMIINILGSLFGVRFFG